MNKQNKYKRIPIVQKLLLLLISSLVDWTDCGRCEILFNIIITVFITVVFADDRLYRTTS